MHLIDYVFDRIGIDRSVIGDYRFEAKFGALASDEIVFGDGKYQLTMFRHSAFTPLTRNMPPMLKEDAFLSAKEHCRCDSLLAQGEGQGEGCYSYLLTI
jgi:hypothetical protein